MCEYTCTGDTSIYYKVVRMTSNGLASFLRLPSSLSVQYLINQWVHGTIGKLFVYETENFGLRNAINWWGRYVLFQALAAEVEKPQSIYFLPGYGAMGEKVDILPNLSAWWQTHQYKERCSSYFTRVPLGSLIAARIKLLAPLAIWGQGLNNRCVRGCSQKYVYRIVETEQGGEPFLLCRDCYDLLILSNEVRNNRNSNALTVLGLDTIGE